MTLYVFILVDIDMWSERLGVVGQRSNKVAANFLLRLCNVWPIRHDLFSLSIVLSLTLIASWLSCVDINRGRTFAVVTNVLFDIWSLHEFLLQK
jgi:hypothetical protein